MWNKILNKANKFITCFNIILSFLFLIFGNVWISINISNKISNGLCPLKNFAFYLFYKIINA